MRRSIPRRRWRSALAVLLVAQVAGSCSSATDDATAGEAPAARQWFMPCARASEVPCISESAVQSVELAGTAVALVYSSGRTADAGSWGGWVLGVQRSLDVPADVLIDADGRRYQVEAMPRVRGEVRTLLVADENAQLVDEFDSAGRLVARRDALTGGARVLMTYGDGGRLEQVDSSDDSPITLSYDSAGHLSRIQAGGLANDVITDADGRIVALAARDGSRWLFGYEDGRLAEVTHPTGATTRFDYSDDGALASIAEPSGRVLSHERQVTNGGRSLRIESSSGAVWSLQERRDGDETTRRFEEAGAGTVVEVATESHRHVERADGSVVDVELSPDPRFGASAPVRARVQLTLPGGATLVSGAARNARLGDSADPLAVKRLDGRSTGVEELTWSYDGTSRVVTETSAEGRTSTWTLDEVGRPIRSKTPRGPDIATTYDTVGRAVAVENGDAKWTRRIDPRAGSIAVTGPLSSSTASFDEHGGVVSYARGDEVETTQAFDSAGRLVEVRPSGAGAHVLARDGDGWISATAPPTLAGSPIADVSYERDVDGNIVRVRRSGDDVVTTGRNQAGAIDTIDAAGLSIVARRDAAGLLERLSVGGGAAVDVERDGDRLVSETWSGPVTGVVRYQYDDQDRLSDMTVGDIETTIERDRDGVIVGLGPFRRTVDPETGLVTTATTGDVTVTMGYDGNGRATAVDVAGPAGVLASRRIGRDVLGRVSRTEEVVGEAVSTAGFGYDAAGRLASSSGSVAAAGATSVGPDGDLATIAGQPSTIDPAGRLTAVGPTNLGYDSAGRVTTMTGPDGVTTYEWDGLGRLEGVRLPDGRHVTYTIDGDGRRIARDVDGKRTTGWLYSGPLRPVAELDANGAVRDVLLYDDDDTLVGILRDGQALTVVPDQVGGPWLIVDARGGVVDHIVRDAAGRIVSETAPDTTSIGFAGGIADPLTGLVHFGAREYSPRLQRWLSPDPIGFASSDSNLYRYADGDPVNKRDPTGLDSISSPSQIDPPRSDAGRILDQVDKNGRSSTASSIEKSFTPSSAPGGPDKSTGRRGSGTVNGTPGGRPDPNVESGDYRVPRAPGSNGGTGDHDRGDVTRPESGDSPSAPEDAGGAAGANGDTHLYTLTRRMYDLQLTGEYVAARDSQPGFEVQIRQVPVTGSTKVATVGAVALDVDGTHVEIHARAHDPLLVDGQRTPVDEGNVQLPGGGTVRHTAGRWQIDWADGSRVDVRGDRRLNVQVRPSPTRAVRIDGLVGTSEGTLRTATGETVEATPWPPTFETVHATFAPTWRLSADRSLFTYEPGESTDGFYDAAFPSGPTDLTTFDPTKVAAARRLCASLGDRGRRAAVDACVLDVAATGDPSFVTDAQLSGVTSPAVKDAGSKSTSSKDEPSDDGAGDVASERGAEMAVADGTLVTGSIDTVGGVARFVVDVPDGLGFALVDPEMSCDLTLSIEGDNGSPLYGSPLCTGNVDHLRPNPKARLQAGRYHLTVRGEGEATGPFTFRYVAAKPKKFTAELGKEIKPTSQSGIGQLSRRGEVHLLRIDADGAAAVKLEGTAADPAACGDTRVVVYDLATGESVLRAPEPCSATAKAALPDPNGSYLAVVDSPTWSKGKYSFRLDRASPN